MGSTWLQTRIQASDMLDQLMGKEAYGRDGSPTQFRDMETTRTFVGCWAKETGKITPRAISALLCLNTIPDAPRKTKLLSERNSGKECY